MGYDLKKYYNGDKKDFQIIEFGGGREMKRHVKIPGRKVRNRDGSKKKKSENLRKRTTSGRGRQSWKRDK